MLLRQCQKSSMAARVVVVEKGGERGVFQWSVGPAPAHDCLHNQTVHSPPHTIAELAAAGSAAVAAPVAVVRSFYGFCETFPHRSRTRGRKKTRMRMRSMNYLRRNRLSPRCCHQNLLLRRLFLCHSHSKLSRRSKLALLYSLAILTCLLQVHCPVRPS